MCGAFVYVVSYSAVIAVMKPSFEPQKLERDVAVAVNYPVADKRRYTRDILIHKRDVSGQIVV